MSVHRGGFDETKYMLLDKNNGLLEKYNEIWNIVSNTIKKRFDNEPVYNKKYLKGRIKFYEGKIITNAHNGKMLEEDSDGIFLSKILIDSVFKMVKNYDPQAFLEGFK